MNPNTLRLLARRKVADAVWEAQDESQAAQDVARQFVAQAREALEQAGVQDVPAKLRGLIAEESKPRNRKETDADRALRARVEAMI